LRIARELPERFRVTGMLVRDAEKGQQLEREWNVPCHLDLDDLLRDKPKFTVLSVSRPAAPHFQRELAERKMPVLAETPPGPDMETMNAMQELEQRGARIQIAEQVQYRPLNAARITLANNGTLGRVTQAQVAVAHGYHGISLLRRYLDVGFEDAKITARHFDSPIVQGPGRAGPPEEEKIVNNTQTLAHFDFGERLGIFDFTGAQYFGWIRASRTLVRGERGEIEQTTVRTLRDFRTPVQAELERRDAGTEDNLRVLHHEGITLANEWVYRNPFTPGRLSDDEIAIATCLQKMAEYVDGGPDFYSFAQGAQDHYLSLMMDEAAKTGQPIQTRPQVWAKA
jgi:predicted dehydrogenase